MLVVYATVVTAASELLKGSKETCVACDPTGVKLTTPPKLGKDDMAQFYQDLLSSVGGIHFSQRKATNLRKRADAAPICCEGFLESHLFKI
jgi:hypothetical protein